MLCFSAIKRGLLLSKHPSVVLVGVFVWFLFLLGASLFVGQHRPGHVHAAPTSPLSDLSIYGDSLASGWGNWSWNTNVNFNNTSPTYGGSTRSIAATYTQGWAGLSLRHDTHIDASLYQAIAFWVHGGSGADKQLRVQVEENDSDGPLSSVYDFTAPVSTWTPVTVTMAALGNPAQIKRINVQDRTGSAQGTFYIDELRLLAASSPSGGASAAVHIQAGGVVTPFSPYMLSSNLPAWLNPTRLADATFRARTAASGLKLLRLPGGSWSNRYGWLSCELGANQHGAEPCGDNWQSWAARPSHFIAFLQATNT